MSNMDTSIFLFATVLMLNIWDSDCCVCNSGCNNVCQWCHFNTTGQTGRLRLLYSLLNDYNGYMRPDMYEGEQTVVTISTYIISFYSVSVDTMVSILSSNGMSGQQASAKHMQDFSLDIYLRQSWDDKRLSYSTTLNISSLLVDSKLQNQIWVPDLYFPNGKQAEEHCATVPNKMIKIFPGGRILYSARYTLRLACHMSLVDFPLDMQTCYMKMESFSHTEDEIKFEWDKSTSVEINKNLQLPQFTLVNYTTSDCKSSYVTGAFSCLVLTFRLHRQSGYYLIQNYIPSMLIVVLSWVSFWINIDAIPARISLGVLTVLTMTTQSVGLWMSLPRVSYVKAMDVWMSTCVAFVFFAILEFATVNTLARKEIRRMSLRVLDDQGKRSLSNKQNDETGRQISSPKHFDPNSRQMARRVDKCARWIFPGAFIIFNILYWSIYLIPNSLNTH